jgi:hypothetical protein
MAAFVQPMSTQVNNAAAVWRPAASIRDAINEPPRKRKGIT